MCQTPNTDAVDWQTGKTPLECTKHILENEHNCDVNFKVGENEESIKAHKLILSMRSAVFDRMFNGGFQESEKDPVIPDVTVGAFKALLRYCYYECLDIEDDVALSVLYASTKYMLPLLEEAARKKLIQILNGSNVWAIYKYSGSVGDAELYKVCKEYFVGSVKGVREALHSEEFLNIQHGVLLEFLNINDTDQTLDLNENQENNENPDCDFSKLKEAKEDNGGGDGAAGKQDKEVKEQKDALQKNCNTLNGNENQTDSGNVETSDCNNVDIKDGAEETKDEGGTHAIDAGSPVGEKYGNNINCRGISISEIELFNACNAWAEAECLRQEIDPTGANKRTVLGECLFLIRFPAMLLKDLMTIVYPTCILTQEEIAKLGLYVHHGPSSEYQVDFPSCGREFIVTPPSSANHSGKTVVVIESTERVLLSKIWTEYPGSYRVTLRDKRSDRSWSTNYETRHDAVSTVSKNEDGSYYNLHYKTVGRAL